MTALQEATFDELVELCKEPGYQNITALKLAVKIAAAKEPLQRLAPLFPAVRQCIQWLNEVQHALVEQAYWLSHAQNAAERE